VTRREKGLYQKSTDSRCVLLLVVVVARHSNNRHNNSNH
jgi:hypothetical protein